MSRTLIAALGIALATITGQCLAAAPGGGGKGPDPSAAAVIADANGKVVGPLVWIPNEPGYLYYGEVGAAYRVAGAGVARVGFLASQSFGVLTRVYRAANLHFTTPDCSGQPYAKYGLPADYLPYSPVFVMPPISLSGNVIAPARVMRQTTAKQIITAQSGTNDAAECLGTYETVEVFIIEQLGDFPFVAPFSIR